MEVINYSNGDKNLFIILAGVKQLITPKFSLPFRDYLWQSHEELAKARC